MSRSLETKLWGTVYDDGARPNWNERRGASGCDPSGEDRRLTGFRERRGLVSAL